MWTAPELGAPRLHAARHPYPGSRMSGRSRHVETAAVTALLPVLALVPFWVLPVGWLLASVVLFVRPLQVLVLTPLFGARRATPGELEVITPVWSDLTQANELPTGRYVVRILPSEELNAFACGGHLVVVTSFAVAELSEAELAGVLAHELSHHLGLHTVALTVGHWL
jgi:Zn-dependent protease with chaperone function